MPTKVNFAYGLLAPMAEGQVILNLSDIKHSTTLSITTSLAPNYAAASGPRANVIRVSPLDGGVHVKAGINPSATTEDVYVPIGASEIFFIQPGDKVAAIED
jgi:hypothetical protein